MEAKMFVFQKNVYANTDYSTMVEFISVELEHHYHFYGAPSFFGKIEFYESDKLKGYIEKLVAQPEHGTFFPLYFI